MLADPVCPVPAQLQALIVWLETSDDLYPEDHALIAWLRAFLPQDRTCCVHCGEDRLIERTPAGWYCNVCGKGWR